MNIFDQYLDKIKKILLDLSKKDDLILPETLDGITCEIPPEKLGGYLKHVYQKLEEKFPKMLLYKLRVVKATCHTTDNKKHQYLYWLVQDWKMDYIDSGWLSNNAPDFLWRTGLKKDWQENKDNPRNPYVIPYFVNQLYQKSL